MKLFYKRSVINVLIGLSLIGGLYFLNKQYNVFKYFPTTTEELLDELEDIPLVDNSDEEEDLEEEVVEVKKEETGEEEVKAVNEDEEAAEKEVKKVTFLQQNMDSDESLMRRHNITL